MNKISNKLVLITGASIGIGAETAIFFASKKATVLLLARDEKRLAEVKERIIQDGGTAHCFPVDLSDSKQVETVTTQIKEHLGVPDIILNNAGSGRWLTIEETSANEAQEMIALPHLAAYGVTKAFIGEMKERNYGHIINLTSDASYLPKGNAIGYTAARYALRGFSESLSAYLVDTNIKVSLAVFGKVESSYWKNNPGSEERIPKPTPFMPVLSALQVAKYLLDIVETQRPILIKPQIFKSLYWAFRKWPKQVAQNIKKSA